MSSIGQDTPLPGAAATGQGPGRPALPPAGAVGILIGLGLLVHGHLLGGTFHYDDLHAIVANQHIRSLVSIPAFFTDPSTFSGLPFGGMFRPLVMSSYSLTYAVFALEPWPYLATNVALHVTVSLSVYALVRRLHADASTGLAAAALVLVHPVNVEVAAYVSSRSESMAALFLLLALTLHTGNGRGRRAAAVASFGAALMSKSVAVVLLPLLALYESAFGAGPWSRRVRALAPYGIVALIYLAWVEPLLTQAVVEAPVRSLVTQGLTQAKALVYYARLLILPHGLSVEHAFDEGAWAQPAVWAAMSMLASLLLPAWRAGTHQRWWLLWIPVVMMPTLVVPLNVLVNEHRLYLVTVAVAALGTGRTRRLPVRVRRLAGLTIVGLAILAFQRGTFWRDEATLWRDALNKAPGMPRTHLFVGDAEAAAGRTAQALAHYDAALRAAPRRLSAGDRLVLHNNRGAVLLARGDFSGAYRAYARALRIDSTYRPTREAVQALLALQQADADEGRAERLRRRGLTALVAGEVETAIRFLRASLALAGDGPTWLTLARAHERLQQWEQAEEIYRMLSLAGKGHLARTAQERRQALAARTGEGP